MNLCNKIWRQSTTYEEFAVGRRAAWLVGCGRLWPGGRALFVSDTAERCNSLVCPVGHLQVRRCL